MVLFVKIILNNDTFRFAKFDIREIASRKKFDTLGRFKIVSICTLTKKVSKFPFESKKMHF